MLMVRFSEGVSVIASIALTTKLIMTCWSWRWSLMIESGTGARKLLSSTFRPAATAETRACRSNMSFRDGNCAVGLVHPADGAQAGLLGENAYRAQR
jgi:hypothetical protein